MLEEITFLKDRILRLENQTKAGPIARKPAPQPYTETGDVNVPFELYQRVPIIPIPHSLQLHHFTLDFPGSETPTWIPKGRPLYLLTRQRKRYYPTLRYHGDRALIANTSTQQFAAEIYFPFLGKHARTVVIFETSKEDGVLEAKFMKAKTDKTLPISDRECKTIHELFFKVGYLVITNQNTPQFIPITPPIELSKRVKLYITPNEKSVVSDGSASPEREVPTIIQCSPQELPQNSSSPITLQGTGLGAIPMFGRRELYIEMANHSTGLRHMCRILITLPSEDQDRQTIQVALPPLPPGTYNLYAGWNHGKTSSTGFPFRILPPSPHYQHQHQYQQSFPVAIKIDESKEESKMILTSGEAGPSKSLSEWIYEGNYERAIYLLEQTSSALNIEDSWKWCALHYAVGNDMLPLVKCLLYHGAFPDPRDSSGATPLFWAIHRGLEPIARALLEADADPSIPNKSGIYPLTLAERNRNSALIELLLSYGAHRLRFKSSSPSGPPPNPTLTPQPPSSGLGLDPKESVLLASSDLLVKRPKSSIQMTVQSIRTSRYIDVILDVPYSDLLWNECNKSVFVARTYGNGLPDECLLLVPKAVNPIVCISIRCKGKGWRPTEAERKHGNVINFKFELKMDVVPKNTTVQRVVDINEIKFDLFKKKDNACYLIGQAAIFVQLKCSKNEGVCLFGSFYSPDPSDDSPTPLPLVPTTLQTVPGSIPVLSSMSSNVTPMTTITTIPTVTNISTMPMISSVSAISSVSQEMPILAPVPLKYTPREIVEEIPVATAVKYSISIADDPMSIASKRKMDKKSDPYSKKSKSSNSFPGEKQE